MGSLSVVGSSSSVLDYTRILMRRKLVFLEAVILVPLVAVLLSLSQAKQYEASAEVLLSNQNLAASLSGTQGLNVNLSAERIAQTQAAVARAPLVAARALAVVGFDGRSAEEFLNNSEVSARSDADLLDFRVRDRDPVVATRLASAYAQEFIAYRRELDTGALTTVREGLEAEIAELEAVGERDSPLYASLVDKEQQLRTLEALQTSNAFLLRPAKGAEQVKPKPVRVGLLALVFGLLLGIGLVFLFEALDTRVRSVDEISERLNLPLLARLATPPRRLRKKSRLVMEAEPNGFAAEAFRVLRTNLELANLEHGASTIMLTSAVRGEGKTTSAANLALALARAGRRVILVDLDLRRPFLHRLFDLAGRPGLTDAALGRVDLKVALVQLPLAEESPRTGGDGNGRTQSEGTLELLAAGPPPPNPDDFLNTRGLEDILADLRERADLVIIDAPPLLQAADAIALSTKVEALIFVARLSTIRRPMLADIARLLAASPAVALGLIVTGAEPEEGYSYPRY